MVQPINNLRSICLKSRIGRARRVLERLRLRRGRGIARDLGACYLRHSQPGKAIGHLPTTSERGQCGGSQQGQEWLSNAVRWYKVELIGYPCRAYNGIRVILCVELLNWSSTLRLPTN